MKLEIGGECMTKSKYVRVFPDRWEQKAAAVILTVGMLYIISVITVLFCWR